MPGEKVLTRRRRYSHSALFNSSSPWHHSFWRACWELSDGIAEWVHALWEIQNHSTEEGIIEVNQLLAGKTGEIC
jgi:hypothetical protein